jgi:hypothetical protein
VALVLFVQASNVYPGLLLGRLLFSLGGSAVSTMVTAVLPTVAAGEEPQRRSDQRSSSHSWRPSLSSEITITPSRFERSLSSQEESKRPTASSSRLAGFVGLFAGCGALIALAVFLPLPAHFEKSGSSPAQAIRQSYYVVAMFAVIIAVCCFFGLRNLPGEEGKSIRYLWTSSGEADGIFRNATDTSTLPYWKRLIYAFSLGFKHPDISLGYVGGFVARASSVGISLFIPLFVNHYYHKSGFCNEVDGDIKRSCREAYILASILTGASQLVALITAPAFGYLSDKSRRTNSPMLSAALLGIVGYVVFPLLPSPKFNGPNGNAWVFIVMALIGMSQIGAIVCSLGVLSNGVLNVGSPDDTPGEPVSQTSAQRETGGADNNNLRPEQEPLLAKPATSHHNEDLRHLKGSIAGMYSLYGGAGILILTKLGGVFFDVLSSGSPFYIMALFNGILLFAGVGCILWKYGRGQF